MIHVVRNTKCRNTDTLARTRLVTRLQNAWRDARMVTRARRYRRRRGRALCMRSLRHRAATLGGFDASRCGARRAGVNQKYVRATVVRCDGIGADARKTVFFVNFNFQLFRKQSISTFNFFENSLSPGKEAKDNAGGTRRRDTRERPPRVRLRNNRTSRRRKQLTAEAERLVWEHVCMSSVYVFYSGQAATRGR